MKKQNTLTIIIGGDVDKDYEELLSAKSLKEIKQPKNILYLESYEQLDRLLSPKKIDLLLYLIKTQNSDNPESISGIAKKLNRHQEAISRDVRYLHKLGLVSLTQMKQTVYAFSKYSKISIQLK